MVTYYRSVRLDEPKPVPQAGLSTLVDLLKKAHTVIGEGLIDNKLNADAAELHDEIGKLFGLSKACACGMSMTDGVCSDPDCRLNVAQ